MTPENGRDVAKGSTVSRGERHRSQPAEKAYEAHKRSWEAKGPSRLRPFNLEPWYKDGRELREYCDKMAAITGDRRFEAFGRLLEEHGLHKGTPSQQAKSYIAKKRPFDDRDTALELMGMACREALANGGSFSAHACAAKLVDEMNLQGTSFRTAVDELRKEFKNLRASYCPQKQDLVKST